MSDMQEWIEKITQGVWDGLGDSAPQITQTIGVMVASKIMSSPLTWASIRQRGRLARAYQGQTEATETFSKSPVEIIHERILHVPYARILEEGGQTRVNPRVASAMYRLYKLTGDRKYYLAFISARIGRSVFEHKARPYLSNAISSFNVEMLSEITRRNIETRLKAIPNLEVVIGTK